VVHELVKADNQVVHEHHLGDRTQPSEGSAYHETYNSLFQNRSVKHSVASESILKATSDAVYAFPWLSHIFA
jgi:hypothetical protein